MKTYLCSILFILNFCGAYASVKPAASENKTSVLYGNYVNAATNEWEYGFFEDFAIYNKKFWEYHTVSVKKNKINLVLMNTETHHELALTVEIKKDGIFTIKQGKDKKKEYFLFNKQLPPYKYAETSAFKPPQFTADSATIIGYYRNYNRLPADKAEWIAPFEVGVPNFLQDEDIEYYTNIDSLGRFNITFPIVNAQELFVDWKRLAKVLVVEPGDTIFLYADLLDLLNGKNDSNREAYRYRPKDLIVMGDNARLNNEIIQYGYQPYTMMVPGICDNKEISDMEYYSRNKEKYEFETTFLENYCKNNPVSSKFLRYQEAAFKYLFLSKLMQRRFVLDANSGNKLDDEYMELVNRQIDLDDEWVYTAFGDFKWFLRDYMGYIMGVTKGKEFMVTFEQIVKEMERRDMITAEWRAPLQQISTLTEKSKTQDPDSPGMNEIKQEFSSLISTLMSTGDFEKQFSGIANELLAHQLIENEISICDSVIPNNTLKQLYLGGVLYSMVADPKKPFSDGLMQIVTSRIHLPYMKETLMGIHQHYQQLENQSLPYAASLVNTSHLAEHQDAEKLFQELIAPYKGKVIYLDFWGTWCSSCLKNIELSGPIKDHFAGKDVVFMYLANGTSQNAWINFIKEMNLTGENIVHYRLPDAQQAMIERKFSVSGFPTYMLIDKEGNVVDTKAPPPMLREKAIQSIEKLLE